MVFQAQEINRWKIKKQKTRLCSHGGIQKSGVNYWETYAPVVNLISVRSLLLISIIHEFLSRLIDFVLDFPQYDLDVDVLMDLPLVILVYLNRVEWVLNLNKSFYGIKQKSANLFRLLKTGLERRVYHNLKLTLVYFTENTQLL